MGSELHDLTALEQAAAVRSGAVSPVELVEHYLRRIEMHNADHGAFVTVTADAALAEAKEAEQAVTTGTELPPLHGVPTAIKDLNLTARVPTKLGSAVFADFVPSVDDHVVTLLRAAGTISLGKTNVPEFGMPCYTEPDVAPPARTPWDLSRSAGGSSGGAGAATAAGLVPFAHGNDGAGSIRIPASVCGLVGLKPARGRVSKGPLQGDLNGLTWDGPLARTVRDAAAMLDAIAGPMPGDPHWAPPLPPGETFLSYTDRDPGRLRIGRFATPVIVDEPVHPDCLAAYEDASALLASLGHEVADVAPPFTADVVAQFEILWSAGSLLVPVPAERETELRPLTRWLRERGRSVGAADYLGAFAGLQFVARTAVAAAAGYDAVLTPTLAQPPAVVGSLRNDDDPVADFEAQKRFTPFTAAYNLTGQPAISLPLHWTDAGLPIGVQLVGRPAGEAALLSLAAQLEAARPWAQRRPPCW
jgi:amidase